jgi:hypothetical protein
MFAATALFVLCAAPVKLAASGFTLNGEDSARAKVWVERFAEVMGRDARLRVTTQSDLAQVLGLERQKQLLGCDTESCMAELANALGTDGVLVGSITHTGDSFLAVVKIIRQTNGSVWWSASGRMTGEPALLDWLDEQASAAVRAIFPPAPLPVGPLVVGGAGIVAVGVGATMLVLSNTVALQAVRGAPGEPELATALTTGRTEGAAGVALLGVGGAAIATAVIWALVRSEPAPAVALSPVPGGVVATVGGTW